MYAFLNINDECIFRRCIPEKNKVEGRRLTEKSCREGEKEQAENATRVKNRHDGERKDKQGREARDAILLLQATAWRKEETGRGTEDKRQRCNQDSWGHPRR